MSEEIMPESYTLDVTADHDVPFRVVYLPSGRSHNFPRASDYGKPSVEFYDRRYGETPDGQFTGGRYFADTLLGLDGYGRAEGGLSLDGGIPAWSVDAATMDLVRAWLTRHHSSP